MSNHIAKSVNWLPDWRQHVGHAIGLRNHEAPFLDVGDHTPVEPGMVFTIEPGLYAADVGGFRHSDTVVVTEDGIDVLTSYPSDIESLTIPASGFSRARDSAKHRAPDALAPSHHDVSRYPTKLAAYNATHAPTATRHSRRRRQRVDAARTRTSAKRGTR